MVYEKNDGNTYKETTHSIMNMRTGFDHAHSVVDAGRLTERERLILAHLCAILLDDAMQHGPRAIGVDTEAVVMGPCLVSSCIKYYAMHNAPKFLDDMVDIQRRVERNIEECAHESSSSDGEDMQTTEDSDNDEKCDREDGHGITPVNIKEGDGCVREDEYIRSHPSVRSCIDKVELEWAAWAPTDPMLLALRQSVENTSAKFRAHSTTVNW